MRVRARYATGLVVAAALGLAFPEDARADDDTVLHVFEGIGVAGAIVGDVVFTSYDIATASKGQQPEKGWMVGQTALAGPQTVVSYIVIAVDAENPDFEARAPLAIPLAIAGSSLATHSIWSVATDRFPPGPRLGASWLIGLDLTFTTLSLSETFSGKLMPKGLGIVEALVMAPEAVLGAVEAVRDPSARGGWIGIAGWSGVLATHGVISLLAGIANPQPLPKAQPRNPHPPAPPPEEEAPEPSRRGPGTPAPSTDPNGGPGDGQWPTEPSSEPPSESSPPPRQQAHRPIVVPATLTDGYRVVPGALVVGVF